MLFGPILVLQPMDGQSGCSAVAILRRFERDMEPVAQIEPVICPSKTLSEEKFP